MLKTKEIQEVVCDVCGEPSDGEYNTVEYVNGNVMAEKYCPFDLCKYHMGIWAQFCSHQSWERYEGSPKDTNEMLEELKGVVEKYESKATY